MGHLEAAAGLAGVVKSILVLEHGVIPPNALLTRRNPDIDADFYNVNLPTQCIPWPDSGLRRVSVNSFGFGGTNSHAVLDDARHYLESHGLFGFHNVSSNDSTTTSNEGISIINGDLQHRKTCSPKLLVWTATDAAALERVVDAYQSYYRKRIASDSDKLNRLAYTLAKRRTIMPCRTFAVVGPSSARNETEDNNDEDQLRTAKPVRAPTEPQSMAFIFTGQGAQYAEMGMELRKYPVFEQHLRKSDDIFARFGCKWSIFGRCIHLVCP